ncbi:MAG TPA: hypothetical protein VHV78_01810 [Gemmatimonadaceae bacterium]|nr:hypothetical protein [Gemmatimonadaceae bacterium]
MRNLRGSALIEVLVGLVVLAIGGTALITLLSQTVRSMESTLATEENTRAAALELNRVTVASRADLLSQLGRQSLHGWTVDIARAGPSLFDVAIASSDSAAPVLRTVLYRPPLDSASASQ